MPGHGQPAATLNKEQLTIRVKYVHEVSTHLQQWWENEYLTQLRLFHQAKSTPVKADDLVFVMDNKRRRQHLKVGLVTKVFVGHDDRVRVVEV